MQDYDKHLKALDDVILQAKAKKDEVKKEKAESLRRKREAKERQATPRLTQKEKQGETLRDAHINGEYVTIRSKEETEDRVTHRVSVANKTRNMIKDKKYSDYIRKRLNPVKLEAIAVAQAVAGERLHQCIGKHEWDCIVAVGKTIYNPKTANQINSYWLETLDVIMANDEGGQR